MNAWFLLPALALVGGLIALIPLGSQVLRRGVVFIDLAVAQAAAAAVLWINVALHLESPLMTQATATVGAVFVSLSIAWITRRWQQQREALIGLIYVAGACTALLGASLHPHGKDQLLQLLAADVLWVESSGVAALTASAVLMLVTQSKKWLLHDAVFYVTFAVIASLAVPALGLFLVFAALIAPALWIEKGFAQPIAIAGAIVASLVGLLASWVFDTPSGPSIVMTLSVFGLFSVIATQKK